MNEAPKFLPANAVLMLMAAGLAALLLWDLASPAPGRLADRPSAAANAGDAPRQSEPGIEQFRAAIERPLFAPSRRPVSASAPAPQAAPALPPLDLELVGIVAAGEDAFVLVRPPGGRAQRLSVGQAVGAWRLDAIERDRADFVRDGTRATLRLLRRGIGQPVPAGEPWLMPSATGSGH
jgi:hypothetical protein